MGFLKDVGNAYVAPYKALGKSLKGKSGTMDTTPQDLQGIRGALGEQLIQGLSGGALAQGFQGALGQGPAQAAPTDTRFFFENLLQPYQNLFEAQRGNAIAQAKQSAGNLTGSSYENILGRATSESLAQEQAFLANVLQNMQAQQQQLGLQRQLGFLNLLFQYAGNPAGQNVPTYTPGLLDSIAPLVGTAIGRAKG